MMVEVALGAGGVLVGYILVQLYAIRQGLMGQNAAILKAVHLLDDLGHVEHDINMEGVIEDITDAITGTLGQMHVPTAGDHLMGMVSTFLQAKMMKDNPAMAALAGLAQGEGHQDVQDHPSVDA